MRDLTSKVDDCLILLVKYPEEGKVKTRLFREIEGDLAVKLYRNFVSDMVSTLDTSEIPYIIAYHPKRAMRRLEKWLGPGHTYLPQRGNNMGQMLKNIFRDTYSRGFKRVIVIASDCPDLPKEILMEAFAALNDHDAVIGPSPDGGYYMIGFTEQAFSSKAFDGITWSTEEVFKETISKLTDQGKSVHISPEWSDVDTLADLTRLFERNRDSKFSTSRTIRMLQVLSGVLFTREALKHPSLTGNKTKASTNCGYYPNVSDSIEDN